MTGVWMSVYRIMISPKASKNGWLLSLMLIVGASLHPVWADQTAKELPALFDQLLIETDPAVVSSIEGRIWQHWLEAPNEKAAFLMSQISRAMSGGDLQIALGICNQLVENEPDFAEAWNKRATIHYLLGNNALSVADIRETVIREPRHFGAISGLGLIFVRQNDLKAALTAFEQVLAISPGSRSAQESAERVREALGREI
jgi:tetratricopeptide (TPR) repeat protein